MPPPSTPQPDNPDARRDLGLGLLIGRSVALMTLGLMTGSDPLGMPGRDRHPGRCGRL